MLRPVPEAIAGYEVEEASVRPQPLYTAPVPEDLLRFVGGWEVGAKNASVRTVQSCCCGIRSLDMWKSPTQADRQT